MPSSIFNHDKELAEFFTDVEYLRDAFKNSVVAPTLTKHIFVIHGVGGVGKSSLLRMFRLHCKSVNVPVALVSGDDSKSALDVLARWTEDLKADNVAFPAFGKTYEHYREIQAKVDTQAKKAQGARGRAADIAGKAASKTAEAAGGALAGAAIGSVIPGIGTAIGGVVGGVLGGMGAEALVDWLRGFLTKPDIDLLLDPTKKLTDDFLADVGQAADKRRIVLMLDTFEQMTALDDWARDVAQRLHANALFVIAGRALPNWSRAWQSWMGNAQVEELKPMSEDDMRELVRRYYATMRGGQPNPTQVDAIIRFARGLPMVVTSAVQLWVKYSVEDFQSVKAEIVANLVDRLIEGVPSTLIPALEAAAIVRWFDQPILRAVVKQDDVRDAYNELRRFPFVRTRVEGLALHDAVREIMDENLRAQDSERHCELHERAAAYFEKRLEKVTDEEAERLGLERLYHRIRADEETGIKLFQEIAEELTRFRLTNRLRALINDVATYPIEYENGKLWREYYSARLAHLEMKLQKSEDIYCRLYQKGASLDQGLLVNVLLSWSEILTRTERLSDPHGNSRVLSVLDDCEKLVLREGLEWARLHCLRASVYSSQLKTWAQAKKELDVAMALYEQKHEPYGLVTTSEELKGIYVKEGNWRKVLDVEERIVHTLDNIKASPLLRARLVTSWKVAWIWMGRYAETEKALMEVVAVEAKLGRVEKIDELPRDLLLAIGMQERYSEVAKRLDFAVSRFQKLGKDFAGDLAYFQGFWGMIAIRCDNLNLAEKLFSDAFENSIDLGQNSNWSYYLGICYLIKGWWERSEQAF